MRDAHVSLYSSEDNPDPYLVEAAADIVARTEGQAV